MWRGLLNENEIHLFHSCLTRYNPFLTNYFVVENTLNLILQHFLNKEKCIHHIGATFKINRTYKFFPFQYTRCQVN